MWKSGFIYSRYQVDPTTVDVLIPLVGERCASDFYYFYYYYILNLDSVMLYLDYSALCYERVGLVLTVVVRNQ